MSLDEHKITAYEDNVKSLPDYPSDAGYTAKQLKEIFDGRTDKEVKEKHNALIEELKTVIAALEEADGDRGEAAEEYADKRVSEHNELSTAHSDIRALIAELTRRLNAIADSDDTTLDQLSEVVDYIKDNRELIESITTAKANASDVYKKTVIDTMISDLEAKIRRLQLTGGGNAGGGGNGSGAIVVSVHDDLASIVPGAGQMYVVMYHDMPYGEGAGISNEIFFRIKIGDGITSLEELPVMSNVQAGKGNGSIILVDPTYDGGDDSIESPHNTADGQFGVSLGKYIKNRGKAAAGFGYNNEITENGARSFTAGANNLIDAEVSAGTGFRNELHGSKHYVSGSYNTVEGSSNTVVGSGNKTTEETQGLVMAGYSLKSSQSGQAIYGRYNEDDADADVIFGGGSGTEDRANVLTVKKDGNVEIKVPNTKAELANHYVYTDALGRYQYEPMNGETEERPVSFMLSDMGGHSDVTGTDARNYAEYPEEGEDTDRIWAYLGSTGGISLSNGHFTTLGSSARATFSMNDENQWTAFKLKIPEDGVYSVTMEYSKYLRGGIIKTYILPLTDDMREEFDPDNAETYGTLYTDEDCTVPYDAETYTGGYLYRSGAKKFNKLTSVGSMQAIGGEVDTAGTSTADKFVEEKIGAIDAAAGEYLLIFRNIRDSKMGNLRLRNLKLVKFTPAESAASVDMSGYATTTQLNKAIEELTEKVEAVSGSTATFKYGTTAPTTLGAGEIFFVYEA